MWVFIFKIRKVFSNIGEKAFPFQLKVLSNIIFYTRHIYFGNRKQKAFLSTIRFLISQDLFLPILRSPAPCYAITYWMILNININTQETYNSHQSLSRLGGRSKCPGKAKCGLVVAIPHFHSKAGLNQHSRFPMEPQKFPMFSHQGSYLPSTGALLMGGKLHIHSWNILDFSSPWTLCQVDLLIREWSQLERNVSFNIFLCFTIPILYQGNKPKHKRKNWFIWNSNSCLTTKPNFCINPSHGVFITRQGLSSVKCSLGIIYFPARMGINTLRSQRWHWIHWNKDYKEGHISFKVDSSM